MMKKLGQPFMYVAVISWAVLIGGIVFAHLTVLPALMSALPGSSIIETGPYPVHDASFWQMIHPITILCTLLALVSNWGDLRRRKLISIAAGIYGLAIIATQFYFVPELMQFINSSQITSVTSAEWNSRGQQWQHLSWIRGSGMFVGFVMLLVALSKPLHTGNDGK